MMRSNSSNNGSNFIEKYRKQLNADQSQSSNLQQNNKKVQKGQQRQRQRKEDSINKIRTLSNISHISKQRPDDSYVINEVKKSTINKQKSFAPNIPRQPFNKKPIISHYQIEQKPSTYKYRQQSNYQSSQQASQLSINDYQEILNCLISNQGNNINHQWKQVPEIVTLTFKAVKFSLNMIQNKIESKLQQSKYIINDQGLKIKQNQMRIKDIQNQLKQYLNQYSHQHQQLSKNVNQQLQKHGNKQINAKNMNMNKKQSIDLSPSIPARSSNIPVNVNYTSGYNSAHMHALSHGLDLTMIQQVKTIADALITKRSEQLQISLQQKLLSHIQQFKQHITISYKQQLDLFKTKQFIQQVNKIQSNLSNSSFIQDIKFKLDNLTKQLYLQRDTLKNFGTYIQENYQKKSSFNQQRQQQNSQRQQYNSQNRTRLRNNIHSHSYQSQEINQLIQNRMQIYISKQQSIEQSRFNQLKQKVYKDFSESSNLSQIQKILSSIQNQMLHKYSHLDQKYQKLKLKLKKYENKQQNRNQINQKYLKKSKLSKISLNQGINQLNQSNQFYQINQSNQLSKVKNNEQSSRIQKSKSHLNQICKTQNRNQKLRQKKNRKYSKIDKFDNISNNSSVSVSLKSKSQNSKVSRSISRSLSKSVSKSPTIGKSPVISKRKSTIISKTQFQESNIRKSNKNEQNESKVTPKHNRKVVQSKYINEFMGQSSSVEPNSKYTLSESQNSQKNLVKRLQKLFFYKIQQSKLEIHMQNKKINQQIIRQLNERIDLSQRQICTLVQQNYIKKNNLDKNMASITIQQLKNIKRSISVLAHQNIVCRYITSKACEKNNFLIWQKQQINTLQQTFELLSFNSAPQNYIMIHSAGLYQIQAGFYSNYLKRIYFHLVINDQIVYTNQNKKILNEHTNQLIFKNTQQLKSKKQLNKNCVKQQQNKNDYKYKINQQQTNYDKNQKYIKQQYNEKKKLEQNQENNRLLHPTRGISFSEVLLVPNKSKILLRMLNKFQLAQAFIQIKKIT